MFKVNIVSLMNIHATAGLHYLAPLFLSVFGPYSAQSYKHLQQLQGTNYTPNLFVLPHRGRSG